MKAPVRLALGASLIGFAPIFVRWINLDGLGPTAIGFWRLLLGGGMLVAWGRSLKAHPLHLVAGLFFAGDLFCWHRSVLTVGAGPGTLLANTQVFWLGLFGILFFGEKAGARFCLSLLLGAAGIWLLSGRFDPARMDRTGLGYGLVTGAFYAGYLLTLRKAGGGLAGMALASFSGALALGGMTWAEGHLAIPSGTALAKLAGLALVAQVLGWLLISGSLPEIPASRGGLILLLQPVCATLWGCLLLGERLDGFQAAGAALTLAGVYLGALSRSTPGKQKEGISI